MRINIKLTAAAILAASVVFAQSEAKKPTGFSFFDRHLTIKPYVSLSYIYDSNVDSDRTRRGDSIFAVQPGVDFVWNSAKWQLAGNLWYRYHAFCKYSTELGENSFGESLRYTYSSSDPSSKGWTLLLSERYALMSQSDSFDINGGGRGIWRDRKTADVTGVLERRFTERLHADIQGQYSLLDYENNARSVGLHGWNQYSVGGQIGYAASKWTDFLLAGGYSRYEMDYANDISSGAAFRPDYSKGTDVYSVQAGLGTRATERISYRALVGASWLDYAGQNSTDNGWTYTLSGNWRVHRQVQLSVVGTSYYQPSDQYIGRANKVYSFSVGVSYLTLGDRLNLTANAAWNFYDVVYADSRYGKSQQSDRNHFATRLGANYFLNRWASLFAQVIWEKQMYEERDDWDYDRIRGILGVRLHY